MVAAVPELHTWYGGCLAVTEDGRVGAAERFADEHRNGEYLDTMEASWEQRNECYARILHYDQGRLTGEWYRLGTLEFPVPRNGLVNTPAKVSYKQAERRDDEIPDGMFPPGTDMFRVKQDIAGLLVCDSRRQFVRGFKMNRYRLYGMGGVPHLKRDDKIVQVEPVPFLHAYNRGNMISVSEQMQVRQGADVADRALKSLAFPYYPGYDEALGMIMAGHCSVALNNRYWLGLSSSKGDLVLGYYRSELAPLNPDNGYPIISKNIQHLADEINELTGGQ